MRRLLVQAALCAFTLLLASGEAFAATSYDLERWFIQAAQAPVAAASRTNGEHVAAFGHVISSSRDGVHWHAAASDLLPRSEVSQFIFADDKWVGVGSGGSIVTSGDAQNWNSRWSGVMQDLQSVAYGRRTFVAVGSARAPHQRVILTSGDAVNWTVRQLSPTEAGLLKIVHAEDRFVAVGHAGAILTSVEGSSWSPRQSPTTNRLSGLVYANGKFVALGRDGVFVSDEGIVWRTNYSGDLHVFDLAHGNGRYVAVGNDRRAWTSTNAVDWEWHETGAIHNLQTISFTGDKFLVGGNAGFLASSVDGVVWHASSVSEILPFRYIAAGNDAVVALGGDSYTTSQALVASSDGSRWMMPSFPRRNMVRLSYAGGKFIAFAHNATRPTRHLVLISTNGATWREEETALNSLPNDVAFGNGVYAASGGSFFASTDGVAWRTLPSLDDGSYKPHIEFGNRRFVSLGSNGRSYISNDGTNWFGGTTGYPAESLAFGNGVFVAVGSRSTNFVMTSADGVNWTRRGVEPASSGLLAVTYGGGMFVAVGSRGLVASSTDGLSWETHQMDRALTFNGVTFFQGKFIATTTEGVVLAAYPHPELRFVAAEGRLHIEAKAHPLMNSLQRSSTLGGTDWTELNRITNAALSALVEIEPSAPKAFYHIAEPIRP